MKFLVFSTLHPGPGLEAHGAFVRERCLRLAAELGADPSWIQPRPWPPLGPVPAALARLPRSEDGPYPMRRPSYPHLPGIGTLAHAERMALGAASSFRELLRNFRPDFVDAHFLFPDAMAALALAAPRGLPCFVTARGSDVDVLADIPRVRRRYRRLLPRAAAVLAVSPELARRLEELVPGLRVHVAPNGVDPLRFARTLRPSAPRLVGVGRLVPDKGVGLLLEALARPEGRDLPPLEWIGEGPERGRLLRRAERLGISGRVHLPGPRSPSEVAALLREEGGIFVFPSRHEGWPNALMEALCCGLAVVAAGVGGVPLLLGEGPYALCLPPSAGPREWAFGIAEMGARRAVDPEGLADAARARGLALAWERRIPALAEIYREILARKPKETAHG